MPFLQSSSRPLHFSTESVEVSLHLVPPPAAHTIVPSLHASLSVPSHGAPRPKPSSTWPSQSLSLLSQISGESIGPSLHADAVVPVHCHVPSAQVSASVPSHGMPT